MLLRILKTFEQTALVLRLNQDFGINYHLVVIMKTIQRYASFYMLKLMIKYY